MTDQVSSDGADVPSNRVPGLVGKKAFAIWMAIAVAIIALDQVTKLAIVRWVDYLDRIPVTSYLNITHHQNKGAAFSFLADAGGWQLYFFSLLAGIVSVVIAVWLYRIKDQRHHLLSAGLALVLGGAIGNLIDRISLGHVTDFIQVLIFGWPFPSFNVADSAITVGAAFLIIDAIFFSGREEASRKG